MIYIENGQDKVEWQGEHEDLVKEIIEYTLKEESVVNKAQISILLVDNNEIMEINREHRNIDKITDVLSFPMLDYPKGMVYKEVYSESNLDKSMFDGDELVLGDIVLSLERAQEQSIDYGHSFKREILYLIIHSVLHLLGYDHMYDNDKERMRKREEEILSQFSINRE